MPAKAGISGGKSHCFRMAGGWLYITANKPRGLPYVGVTADLAQRVGQHREGKGSAFCRRYNLIRLVYAEPYPTILEAIAREKAIKAWRREWKIELIEQANPDWRDLFDELHLPG